GEEAEQDESEDSEQEGRNEPAETSADGEEDSGEEEGAPQEMDLSGEEQEAGETEAADGELQEMADEDMASDAEEPGESRRRELPFSNLPPPPDYKVFTRRFDETVTAEDLCDQAELDRLRGYLDK